MEVHNPLQTRLNCPTCRKGFTDDNLHKQHYKSDFHRYNLKRKMVDLPPATQQQFSTKQKTSPNERETIFVCNQCRKVFNSRQTLNQHAQSKRHNINFIRQQPVITKQKKVTAPFEKNCLRCMFCLWQSASIQQNLQHMNSDHSFFIAQQKFCVDKKSLIQYLQQKIQVGMLCINCDNKKAKDFTTGDAVRKHMRDKCHTFMKTEDGFEQYEKFYDFSEQFNQKVEEQKGLNIPGIEYKKVKVIMNEKNKKTKNPKPSSSEANNHQQQQNQEQGQWSSQDEGQQDGQWQDQQEDQEAGEQINEQKQKIRAKVYNIMVPTITSTEQLLLPNGKTLGHRKYRRFYKQSIRINTWMNTSMKQLGCSQNSHALINRQKLMQIMKKEQFVKKFQTKSNKQSLRIGMNNNYLMQFFRIQNAL